MTTDLVELDSPSKYEIASDAQNDKKRTENDEVDVEFCMFNVENFENVVGIFKQTLALVILLAIQRLSVKAVDGLKNSFERISATIPTTVALALHK